MIAAFSLIRNRPFCLFAPTSIKVTLRNTCIFLTRPAV
ncbi:hypothetical protein NT03LS_0081, partial [Listeria seeligeri FSL N1-067]